MPLLAKIFSFTTLHILCLSFVTWRVYQATNQGCRGMPYRVAHEFTYYSIVSLIVQRLSAYYSNKTNTIRAFIVFLMKLGCYLTYFVILVRAIIAYNEIDTCEPLRNLFFFIFIILPLTANALIIFCLVFGTILFSKTSRSTTQPEQTTLTLNNS